MAKLSLFLLEYASLIRHTQEKDDVYVLKSTISTFGQPIYHFACILNSKYNSL